MSTRALLIDLARLRRYKRHQLLGRTIVKTTADYLDDLKKHFRAVTERGARRLVSATACARITTRGDALARHAGLA